VLPGATISDGGSGAAIDVGGGDNNVTVTGGTINTPTIDAQAIFQGEAGTLTVTISGGVITSEDEVVRAARNGVTTLQALVTGGTLTAGEEVIYGGELDDEITVTGGTLIGSDDAIQSFEGNDTITITGGTIIELGSDAIDADSGNDIVSVSNALIDATDPGASGAIRLGAGSDQLTLGDGADIRGLIRGGTDTDLDGPINPQPVDTLRFSHSVEPDQVDVTCRLIAAENPTNGSITINEFSYSWEEFEVLECDLTARVDPPPTARPAQPVPTLSTWLLFLLAGVIGAIGVRAVRSS
ncbi:MAG: hypothetical protein AAGF46_13180, partial [Pseudomonadota bacterium]